MIRARQRLRAVEFAVVLQRLLQAGEAAENEAGALSWEVWCDKAFANGDCDGSFPKRSPISTFCGFERKQQ